MNASTFSTLSASTTATVKTPIHFPTDRECLERIAPTVGRVDLNEVTYGWIKNSLELGFLKLSENLRGEIEKNPRLEILGPAEEMEFDAAGNLAGLSEEIEKAGVLQH